MTTKHEALRDLITHEYWAAQEERKRLLQDIEQLQEQAESVRMELERFPDLEQVHHEFTYQQLSDIAEDMDLQGVIDVPSNLLAGSNTDDGTEEVAS